MSLCLLYFNPFFGYHQYPYPSMEGVGVTESTFPHITRLSVDCQRTLQKTLLKRYTNVNILIIDGNIGIALAYISNLHELPPMCALHLNSKTLISFLVYRWPHIIHLQINIASFSSPESLTSNEIDRRWHMFDHIEIFSFHRTCVHDPPRLSNSITKSISNVRIKQNTKLRHLDYFYDGYYIDRLWLSNER